MTEFNDRDTWEQKPRFKLRRFGTDGAFFLPIDRLDESGLPFLSAGYLALELREGVAIEEAQALVDALQEKVAFVIYTGKPAPEWTPMPGRREAQS